MAEAHVQLVASSNKCASDTTGNGSVGLTWGPGSGGGGASDAYRRRDLGGGDTRMGHSVAKGSLNHTMQMVSKQGSWFLVPGECCEKGSSQGQKNLA